MATILDELSKQAELLEDRLVFNYKRLGLKASGQWADNLSSTISFEGSAYKMRFFAPKYTEQLIFGRKTTRNGNSGGLTLRKVIEKWIIDKGIIRQGEISVKSLAFLIARKIHEKGIKVPSSYNSGTLISDIINEESVLRIIDRVKINLIPNLNTISKK